MSKRSKSLLLLFLFPLPLPLLLLLPRLFLLILLLLLLVPLLILLCRRRRRRRLVVFFSIFFFCSKANVTRQGLLGMLLPLSFSLRFHIIQELVCSSCAVTGDHKGHAVVEVEVALHEVTKTLNVSV